MKKWILVTLTLLLSMILVACGSEKEAVEHQSSKETMSVFTDEDIEKVNEMISFLNDKMEELEVAANESIQNGEIKIGDNDQLKKDVQRLGQKMVIIPFIDKYPNSIVSRADKEKMIPITVEADSSESCAFGNCAYDQIGLLELEYDSKSYREYYSNNFKVTQLIFEDVKIISTSSGDSKEEESELRIVKTKNNELILTSIPHIQSESIYLDEYDKELESIKTKVPESEVEAEQAEYKEEIQEMLEKFPELQ